MTSDKPEREIFNIDTSRWMKKIQPVNSDSNYYEDARLISKQIGDKTIPIEHTLVIFKLGGTGIREFYCELHRMVYPINGTCPGCQQNAPDASSDNKTTRAVTFL